MTMEIIASTSNTTPSMLFVRNTVCFDDSFTGKRSMGEACNSRNKRQRFSETMPPCFPPLPDDDETEEDVIANFDIPTLNLPMKRTTIFRTPRSVSDSSSSPSSMEPMMQSMSLEESPAWEEHEDDLQLPSFVSTPKGYPNMLPRPSQRAVPAQQSAKDDVTALRPAFRRTFPDTIFLPQLPTP